MVPKLASRAEKMWSVVQIYSTLSSSPEFPTEGTEVACFRDTEDTCFLGHLTGSLDNQERCLPNYKLHEVPISASNLYYHHADLCPGTDTPDILH